ncbi:MAG TPA: hypothetical protein VF883_15805 [Thermoanaerobaculia bacterium]|jgi:Tfp pilus assembly protein PilO
MIWREKRTLLIILGLLLLGNVVFFLTYRVQYQTRLDEMDQRLAQAEAQLEKSNQTRLDAEAAIGSYRKVERDVETVLDQHWSTQPRRLTMLIAEVKRLAEASNAVPKTYTFANSESVRAVQRGTRGAKKDIGAREVTINFSVEATYDQVRRMINLLELSQQFVIIEKIALNSGEQNLLTLTLQLKTLFRDDESGAASNRL